MTKINKLVLAFSVAATGLVISSAAFASGVIPQEVPEPGIFGIVAAGAAAVILTARFRSKM